MTLLLTACYSGLGYFTYKQLSRGKPKADLLFKWTMCSAVLSVHWIFDWVLGWFPGYYFFKVLAFCMMAFDSSLSKLILKLCEHHLLALEQQLDSLVKFVDSQFGWVRVPMLLQHLKQADYYLSTSSIEQLRQVENACQDLLEHVKVISTQTLKNASHMRKRAASTEARKSLDSLPEPTAKSRVSPLPKFMSARRPFQEKTMASPFKANTQKVRVKMHLRVSNTGHKALLFPYFIWLEGRNLYWQALGDDVVKSDTLKGVTLENPQKLVMKLQLTEDVKTVVFSEPPQYTHWGEQCLAALS
jgi:hypothetical protein